jgi:hypothetical protein
VQDETNQNAGTAANLVQYARNMQDAKNVYQRREA